ncbi:MAG: S9 family peptidase [Alphaproteobacteria bacterium]|nr:S9 family peptidase [Alphaproteobacteria bacterium]
MEEIPAIPAAVTDALLQYQNARAASFQSWAPDGGILIRTRFGETFQIHRLSGPMMARTQLTFFNEPVAGASYPRVSGAPGFVYAKDTGGDENFQIYYRDEAMGREYALSEPGTRNTGGAWSHDGKRIAWSQQTKDSPVYKVMVADVADPATRKTVFEREGAWSAIDWTQDGSKLLLINSVSVAEDHLYVLDLASGELTEINKSDDKIAYVTARFTPDGQSVITALDAGREFLTLARIPVAGGDITWLSSDIAWDVEDFDLSPDGTLIAFSTNENGLSKIHVRRLADGAQVRTPDLPLGIAGGLSFDPEGKHLGFTFSNSQSSGDVWTFAIETGELTRWTASEVGGLDTTKFIVPELIAYPTFDEVDGQKRMIPAFYYKPAKPGPLPVIIYIHGGPESQERPGFTTTYQYWLNELGIAILAPNVRGSTGYGKTYVSLDNGMKREDSVKDIGALLDWIATQPDLDASRVMVYGGSYGGYMVNAAMTHFSDRLAGGVSVVGISNFVTFLENTSGYRRDLRRVEYGDERDPEMRKFLEQISPLTNAAKISKPLFIIQGANDPRVPASEAEQMLELVRKNGGAAWYLLAKDEGHGFQKKSNRDFQNAAVVLFLKQNLLGETMTQ